MNRYYTKHPVQFQLILALTLILRQYVLICKHSLVYYILYLYYRDRNALVVVFEPKSVDLMQ